MITILLLLLTINKRRLIGKCLLAETIISLEQQS